MNAPLAPSAALDIEAIRSAFPILARKVNGKRLAYLDSAASAQKPAAVLHAMTEAAQEHYANVHRGIHTLANEATEAFEGARVRVAQFLGAPTAETVVFTRGTTEAINLVASGLGAEIGEGDEIVLTQMEHHSNIVPWHFLRERHGAVLRFVPVDETGALDMEAFASMVGPRTKMVACTHMSNVLGTVPDVAEIVRIAHAAGAPVLLDGSQAAVHLPKVDVAALGVDFYAVTAHKLYGPTGIGALYMTPAWAERLRPYQGGGEMIESVSEEGVTYNEPPFKFEAGTPAILEAIGFAAALDWMATLDRDAVAAHEGRLARRLTEGLTRWDDVRILGETPEKGAIVTFHSASAHAHDIAQILDRYGVAVRAGQHCAEPLMRRFGAASTCRASFAAYNADDDVEALLAGYEKARSLLAV